MDLILPHLNQHDLFINALLCSDFDLETVARKVHAYARTLKGHEQQAFVRTVHQYLVDAEFFNKQDQLRILRQISRTVSPYN